MKHLPNILTAGRLVMDRYERVEQVDYKSARDIVTEVEVPGIWVGHLVLENLDKSGSQVSQERNAYQVVTAADGTRRIAVSTPLDAYDSDQSGA